MSVKNIVSLLAILAVAVADMATDIYAVALPCIAQYFNVEGNVAQLTIGFNLLGLALSGLVYGPLSDYYGRRPIMLIGMAIFTLASIVCCIVDDIELLIFARFIQGTGSGVAGVVGYAAIRDMYSGSEYAKEISKLNMVVALSPGIAPIIGSHIISHGYDWHFLFLIILIASIITFTLLYFKFNETLVLDTNTTHSNSVRHIFAQYLPMFKNHRFIGHSIIHGLTFMWVWAYVANYPFIFESMGVAVKHYGYLILAIVIFYIIGTLINRKFVSKLGISKMLIIGLTLPILSDSVLAYLYYINKLDVLTMMIIWIPNNIGLAIIISNNVTSALEVMKNIGVGSAVLTFFNMACGSIGTYIVGKFLNYGVLPNLILTIICSTFSISIYFILRRTHHNYG